MGRTYLTPFVLDPDEINILIVALTFCLDQPSNPFRDKFYTIDSDRAASRDWHLEAADKLRDRLCWAMGRDAEGQ